MSEVQRFWSHEARNIRCVREADFDRVTAERDALQLRLTAADKRADKLTQQLAIESAIKEPAGEDVLWQVLDAAVGVLTRRAAPHAWESEAYQAGLKIILARRAGLAATALKPAEAPRNQCDGCQAGIPLINGTHRMGREGGYPDFMGCSAKLYKPAQEKPE